MRQQVDVPFYPGLRPIRHYFLKMATIWRRALQTTRTSATLSKLLCFVNGCKDLKCSSDTANRDITDTYTLPTKYRPTAIPIQIFYLTIPYLLVSMGETRVRAVKNGVE